MKKKSNIGLIISFVILLVVAILGVGGTFYFRNQILDKENTSNDNLENNNTVLDDDSSSNFTFLTVLSGYDEEVVYVGDKKLEFSVNDGQLVFNDKIIEESVGDIYVTNLVVLITKNRGISGYVYSAYDLDGNKVTYSIPENFQFLNLRIEDGKLTADVTDINTVWLEGYNIGNLIVSGRGGPLDCEKTLSDYPEIVEEHKDDILDAKYHFEYANNELSLKIDEVILTVGQLAEQSQDICAEEQ